MSVDIYVPGHSDHPDTMNVANENFVRLMRLIGLEVRTEDGLCGNLFELGLVRNHVVSTLHMISDFPELDAGTEARIITPEEIEELTPGTRELVQALGAQVIDCGWPPGYIRQRLGQLLRLIDFAIREGKGLRYS